MNQMNQTEKFSIAKCNQLIRDGIQKDLLDAKTYFLQFFYPLSNGMILYKNGTTKTMISIENFRATYGNRLKSITKWFLTETEIVYNIVIDTKAPFIQDDNLNNFAGFEHKISEYNPTDDVKVGVDMMLDFIKSVWCSDNNDSFEYIMKWIANMAQGAKNNTILYLKSYVEGIGKSTVTSFLSKHVIGSKICIESNSDPLKTVYNEILSGKLMVVFEELESANSGDWNVMSTKLKRWSTSDEIVYSDKYIKSYTSNNINNYIICTNQDAVKSSEGRRYFVCDLSTKYKGNHAFFKTLYGTCFNDEVGNAFFQYLQTIDIAKFNPQNMPETKSKVLSQSDRLHSLFKFIKFNYILKGLDLKISTKDLYKEYSDYLIITLATVSMTKNKMIGMLREHGIDYKAANSKALYNISNQMMRSIGDKFKWFYEDDVDDTDDNLIVKPAETDYMKIKKTEYSNLQDQIAELKKQLDDMKTPPKATKTTKQKVVKTSKMSLENVSDKSLFDSLPSNKKIVKKRQILTEILDDL